ncbi:hypothetical protein KI387_013597, partial [Taxus chinensis]
NNVHRDEYSCLMMDDPMLFKNSIDHEDVQEMNLPSPTQVLQDYDFEVIMDDFLSHFDSSIDAQMPNDEMKKIEESNSLLETNAWMKNRT